MSDRIKVKVIGTGGIGKHLIDPLSRYLAFSTESCEITLIDGDEFEERNKERQCFSETGNKAEVTMSELRDHFPSSVHFRAKAEYVTDDNVITFIRENDIVFLCVDNHATRKLVSERCAELDDVLLISGGNDYTDGNVIYYLRRDGDDVTKSPIDLFPSIAQPEDKNPGEMTEEEREGCDLEAQSHPQLIMTNLAIASAMLNVYYAHEQGKAQFEQVYVDVLQQRMRPSP